MPERSSLTAKPRSTKGKSAARRLRRQGYVPAVFYGRGQETRSLYVESRELKAILSARGGAYALFQLRLDDNGSSVEKTVMVKEYQLDPVRRTLLHADFYEVDLSRRLEVDVPLVLVGKPVGAEKGGLLQQIRRELRVSALPQALPQQIEVDVSHLDLGDSIHVSEVTAPEGAEIMAETNFTLVTVSAPTAEPVEEEAEVEGEVEEEAAAEAVEALAEEEQAEE